MSWDDLSQTSPSWPPLAEVHAYRRKVYTAVRLARARVRVRVRVRVR